MKKKNCRYDWVFPVVMIISFFFILPFSVKYGWFDFLEDEKFDPEKDVCLEMEDFYCTYDCGDGGYFNDKVIMEYINVENKTCNLSTCVIHKKNGFEFFIPNIEGNPPSCIEWRPKNECEKGNRDYWYVNEVKSDGKNLYYTGGKVCAIKMKSPNQSSNAAKMEIIWGDNTHSVYKDGIYVGEIKEGDDTSWVR